MEQTTAKGEGAYFVSMRARVGYILVFLGCVPFFGFGIVPFVRSRSVAGGAGRWVLFALGICAAWIMIYSMVQFFRTTPRFVVDHDGFLYRGLLLRRYFRWSDIASGDLYSRPFAILLLRLHAPSSRRRVMLLDMSGLSPHYRTLYSELRRRMPGGSGAGTP